MMEDNNENDQVLAGGDDESGGEASLPLEIFAQVFTHLDLPTKKTCRLVCSTWNNVLCDLFLQFKIQVNPSNLSAFQQSSVTFDSVTVNHLSSSSRIKLLGDAVLAEPAAATGIIGGIHFPPDWKFSTQKLIIDPAGVSFPTVRWVPRLKRSEKRFDSSDSSYYIRLLLQRCRDVERISFLRNSLMIREPFSLDQMYFSGLKSLEIFFSYDPTISELERLKELGALETPKLENLTLDMRISLCSQPEAVEFYSSVFSMIVSKKMGLKTLGFNFDAVVYPFQESLVTEDQFEQVENLTQDILDLQLDNLCFSVCSRETERPFTLGIQLLQNQIKLKSLKATFLIECSHLYSYVEEAIRRNSGTLTSVAISNGSYPGKSLKPQIQSSLSHCHHLESLQFSGFYIHSMSAAISRSARTLRRLDIAGELNPGLLKEIRLHLVNLEYLKYWYNMMVNISHYLELEENIKGVIRMPRILEIKIMVGGLDLDFLLDEPNVHVFGNRNGLHECTIKVCRSVHNDYLLQNCI